MKFGGSSLANAASIKNVIEIIINNLHLIPLLVISAIGKTTRNILKAAEFAANKDTHNAFNELSKIREYHFDICGDLGIKEDKSTLKKMDDHFSELEELLEMIATRGKLSPFLQDKALSFGELISTIILTAAFNQRNIKASLLDARICLITDEYFTQAHPQKSISYSKINEYIKPVLKSNSLPVIQGYIGSTISGETTTLGFEGSDYSAVFMGVALDVSEIQIWKDVPGIMTADPDIVKNVSVVKNMSYDETAELSTCGAKILYPGTIEAAHLKNIPIVLKNFNAPLADGTKILKTALPKSTPKSVTEKNSLSELTVKSKELINSIDFQFQVFETLKKYSLAPLHIQGTETMLIFIIKTSANLTLFVKDCSTFAASKIKNEMATISLVGDGIGNNAYSARRVEKLLENTSGKLIRSIISDNSLTYLVNEKVAYQYVRKIHNYFFEISSIKDKLP
jgi:aspartate kinase